VEAVVEVEVKLSIQVNLPGECFDAIAEAFRWKIAHNQANDQDVSAVKGISRRLSSQKLNPGRKPALSDGRTNDNSRTYVGLILDEDELVLIVNVLQQRDNSTHATLWEDPQYQKAINILWSAFEIELAASGRKPPMREVLDPAVHHSGTGQN
jgi:hypothetical protein